MATRSKATRRRRPGAVPLGQLTSRPAPPLVSASHGRPRSPRARPPRRPSGPRFGLSKPRLALSKKAWYAAGALAIALTLAGLTVVPRPSRAVIKLVSPALAPDEKAVPRATLRDLQDVALATLVASWRHSPTRSSALQQLPSSAPLLEQGGKAEVLYFCNEHDGYCSDASWPLVMALDQFGTFHRLGYVASVGSHNPATIGLDFYQSSYASRYIRFVGLEMYTTHRLGAGRWQPLQELSPAQQDVLANWDIPPYTSASGTLPFIDFGGHYYLAGPGYPAATLATSGVASASALQATWAKLAGSSGLAQAARSLAARMVGAICLAINDTAGVCHQLPAGLKDIPLPNSFNQQTAPPPG